MFLKCIGFVGVLIGIGIGVLGCIDGYGYGGVGVGYVSDFYGYGYGDGYYGGGGYGVVGYYDGYGYGGGYGGLGGLFGWYGDYYYFGSGIYVYDCDCWLYWWNDGQCCYWEGCCGNGCFGINWGGFVCGNSFVVQGYCQDCCEVNCDFCQDW